ncbi:spermidine/putrescine ABC transporter substrate-binding protein [Leucobacter sp. UT-8R-CII-1-4]|uniref:ABC transporter substrate-binding protein n=1 Tax=Leucobacter sp. UT-8R-CII-1-4 TaxID=3040075 RepID=UPI0024A923BB|nr:spermidine/putrescine ABC transporter substrate-binding protein [Leucobacter sp. UT-8R-CII-1-4]MDI6023284.1 spermidine/putrescine ABC transporter substrate-binding protein [Leucobacter sp. UT-8R-CII-1-4]
MSRLFPEDPLVRTLVEQAKTASLSRRGLLRSLGLGGAALGLGSLAGCATNSGPGDGSAGTIRWANWTYYLDYDEETGSYPTLDAFQESTNIRVEYFEDIDDNKVFIAKIKDQLKLGQDTGYDTFCLTDSSLVRLLEQDQLTAFDRAQLPNVAEQMIPMVQKASFDPDREWSIPYQAGMTGLVYNSKLYPKGVRHVSDLWAPDLKGKVTLLSEQDDTVSLVMLEQGVDIEGDWGDTEFFAALDEVEKQIKSGQVFNVKGNSYTQDLQTEAAWAGMAWSGDVAMLNDEAGEEIWKFVVPEEGATLFIDSFCMPTSTAAFDQVHKLIDYYYEPEIAAQVAAYVQYVTPVAGAREAMDQIDPELAANTLIFPDEEMSARVFDMRSLTSEEDNRYSQAYQKVLGN